MASATLNGELEKSMGRLGMEGKRGEEQEDCVVWGARGCGERRREPEMGSYWRTVKERLLMETKDWGEEQFTWKRGWPQPGMEPKGKESAAAPNGGHVEELEAVARGVQVRAAAGPATTKTTTRKMNSGGAGESMSGE